MLMTKKQCLLFLVTFRNLLIVNLKLKSCTHSSNLLEFIKKRDVVESEWSAIYVSCWRDSCRPQQPKNSINVKFNEWQTLLVSRGQHHQFLVIILKNWLCVLLLWTAKNMWWSERLGICLSCHDTAVAITEVEGIVVRHVDPSRVHVKNNGQCSCCGKYWKWLSFDLSPFFFDLPLFLFCFGLLLNSVFLNTKKQTVIQWTKWTKWTSFITKNRRNNQHESRVSFCFVFLFLLFWVTVLDSSSSPLDSSNSACSGSSLFAFFDSLSVSDFWSYNRVGVVTWECEGGVGGVSCFGFVSQVGQDQGKCDDGFGCCECRQVNEISFHNKHFKTRFVCICCEFWLKQQQSNNKNQTPQSNNNHKLLFCCFVYLCWFRWATNKTDSNSHTFWPNWIQLQNQAQHNKNRNTWQNSFESWVSSVFRVQKLFILVNKQGERGQHPWNLFTQLLFLFPKHSQNLLVVFCFRVAIKVCLLSFNNKKWKKTTNVILTLDFFLVFVTRYFCCFLCCFCSWICRIFFGCFNWGFNAFES